MNMSYDSLDLLCLGSILRISLDLSFINYIQQKLFEDLIHTKEYIIDFEEEFYR